jgi:hypothetical protein
MPGSDKVGLVRGSSIETRALPKEGIVEIPLKRNGCESELIIDRVWS